MDSVFHRYQRTSIAITQMHMLAAHKDWHCPQFALHLRKCLSTRSPRWAITDGLLLPLRHDIRILLLEFRDCGIDGTNDRSFGIDGTLEFESLGIDSLIAEPLRDGSVAIVGLNHDEDSVGNPLGSTVVIRLDSRGNLISDFGDSGILRLGHFATQVRSATYHPSAGTLIALTNARSSA